MNRILLLVLGALLIVVGFTGRLYFSHYRGTIIPNPFLLWVVSIGCVIIGGLLVAASRKIKFREKKKEFQLAADKLKQNGEKINAPFDQCEVKAGDKSVIIFVYNNPRTGRSEKFMSEAIAKDSVTLSFYLEKQKNISIYVDRSDRSK